MPCVDSGRRLRRSRRGDKRVECVRDNTGRRGLVSPADVRGIGSRVSRRGGGGGGDGMQRSGAGRGRRPLLPRRRSLAAARTARQSAARLRHECCSNCARTTPQHPHAGMSITYIHMLRLLRGDGGRPPAISTGFCRRMTRNSRRPTAPTTSTSRYGVLRAAPERDDPTCLPNDTCQSSLLRLYQCYIIYYLPGSRYLR